MLERNRGPGRGNGCLLATVNYIATRTSCLAFSLTEGVRRTTAKDVCYRMYSLPNKRFSKALILLSSEAGGSHLQCICPSYYHIVPRDSVYLTDNRGRLSSNTRRIIGSSLPNTGTSVRALHRKVQPQGRLPARMHITALCSMFTCNHPHVGIPAFPPRLANAS
jgi:hypothetical protein